MFGIYNKYKAERIRERMSNINACVTYLERKLVGCNRTIRLASSRCDGNKAIRAQQMKDHPNVRDRDLQADITWDHRVMIDNEIEVIEYTEKINEYNKQYAKLEEQLEN